MQTTMSIANILIAALLATPAIATPALFRRSTCDVVPPMAADASVKPLSTPSVTTADLCRQACEANASCQAYVFGLPASASAPTCKLFAVPAAQVPVQDGDSDLHVFDKACTSVPNVAPTHDAPRGTRSDSAANSGNTGNANTGSNTQKQNQPAQQQKQGKQQKRNQCGATPSGPSSNSPSPLQTLTTPADLAACLALCKSNPSCKAVEFGRPSPNEPVQCLLFSVATSELPPPASGATFVASDVGC